jgi:hypothetical protein
MNDSNNREDIYHTYKPKALLQTELLSAQKEPCSYEINGLISSLLGKIPFDEALVTKLKHQISREMERTPEIARADVILFFHKYGIPPLIGKYKRIISLGLRNIGMTSWRDFLSSILGDFPLIHSAYKYKDTSIISRVKALLRYLVARDGKIPGPTEKETISIARAIERGEYRTRGVANWIELVTQTFDGAKDAVNAKRENNVEDPRYINHQLKNLLPFIKIYISALSLDDSFYLDVTKAFNSLFSQLPKHSSFKNLRCLAEILVFHVMKEKGMLLDSDLFRMASPLGSMPMCYRSWLLRYQQFLVPGVYPKTISPDNFLERLYVSEDMTEIFKKRCELYKHLLMKNFQGLHARIIAGIACYFALKNSPDETITIGEALSIMGIEHAGTINNAISRLKKRREYREDMFR